MAINSQTVSFVRDASKPGKGKYNYSYIIPGKSSVHARPEGGRCSKIVSLSLPLFLSAFVRPIPSQFFTAFFSRLLSFLFSFVRENVLDEFGQVQSLPLERLIHGGSFLRREEEEILSLSLCLENSTSCSFRSGVISETIGRRRHECKYHGESNRIERDNL